MTQVADILRDALGHLKVQDANSAIKAIDARDGIRALNMMVRRWEADGLALGWTDVSDPTEVLPLPAEAEEAVGYNLALRLRARYGVTLDPDVIELARVGLAALRRDVYAASPLSLATNTPCSGGRWNIYTDEPGWTR